MSESMRSMKTYENIVNDTEDMVAVEIASQLRMIPDDEICKCDECLCDMVCYALNHLPPRYRVSLLGAIYSADNQEMKARVEKKVKSAIDKIRKVANHSF